MRPRASDSEVLRMERKMRDPIAIREVTFTFRWLLFYFGNDPEKPLHAVVEYLMLKSQILECRNQPLWRFSPNIR